MTKKAAVIICAAGSSTRFGSKTKKTFVDIDGRATFVRSIELFSDRKEVKQIILAISPEDEEMVNIKWGAKLTFYGVKVCHGGAERFETVQKAMELVKDDIDIIAVHDAARCCATDQWIDACFKKAAETGAAMLACPVVATIKKVKEGIITETVDRSDLYEAQTPQIFDAKLLKEAYANIGNLDKSAISDDSQLVEAIGQKVHIVETDTSNIKITCQGDVAIAAAILKSRQKEKTKKKGYVGPFYEAKW